MPTPFKKIKHTTDRLVIRPYFAKDYTAWKVAHDGLRPKRNKFDPGKLNQRKLTPSSFKKSLERYKKQASLDEFYKFGVFHKITGEHLGAVDLYIIVREVLGWANVGYEIHNNQWNQGYAKEAAKAAVEIGFKHLGLHRIEAAMELDHKASQSVARGIGMRKEGVRKRFFPTKSGWEDLVVFAAVK